MALWLQKAQINHPSQMLFNRHILEYWSNWAHTTPNTLLIGTRGSGRTTFWKLYLRHYVSLKAMEQTSCETLQIKNKKKTEPLVVKMMVSPISIALDLTKYESYDQDILTAVLAPILEVPPNPIYASYRVIILEGAECLSSNAQQALRRILEKNVKYNRFIFVVTHEHSLNEALRSRCEILRLETPNQDHLHHIWNKVLPVDANESWRTVPPSVLEACNNTNIKTMLIYGQLYYSSLGLLKHAQPPITPYMFTTESFNELVIMLGNPSCPTTKLVELARKLINVLMNQCLPMSEICLVLLRVAMKWLFYYKAYANPNPVQHIGILANILGQTESRIRAGNQPIYHLEFGILSVLQVCKHYIASLVAVK